MHLTEEIISKTGIPASEFAQFDIRIGQIDEAGRVPKSTKLLKLLVNFGSEQRTILTNIGEQYEPEALLGKKCPFVLNLPPRKMMGIESNGMILATAEEPERIALLEATEDVGARCSVAATEEGA